MASRLQGTKQENMELKISEELDIIIKYSREEALRTGSYGIGPDHLFWGCCAMGTTMRAALWRHWGPTSSQ